MTGREVIAAAYDAGVEEEYARLVSHPLYEAEFFLITDLMKKYIPSGSVVIDIGAGPGRYAEYLLQRNCKVGLADLSAKSLECFNQRITSALARRVLFSRVACATDMSFVSDSFADAVMLMGPLYHLTNCDARAKAISEAFRILKKGGYLFAVFLNHFEHPHHHHDEEAICCSDTVKKILHDSVTTVSFQGYQVPQYRCLPEVAKNSFEPRGFGTLHVRNLEGVGCRYSESDLQKYSDADSKKHLFDELLRVCENPVSAGLADQFLYVGRKNF